MKLQYNSVNDIAVFPEISYSNETDQISSCDKLDEPYIKPEYANKTYYCVYELKKDWYSTRDCGWMSKENKWYYKGYYVIPVYLAAYKWVCGNKIVMLPRKFCDIFGSEWPHEPQDVPREQWWIASKFKGYWGIIDCSYLSGYIEDVELYDNVNEAIERAKQLDQLMKINEEIAEITVKLERRKAEKDNLDDYFRHYSYRKNHGTQRQQLEYQLKELTYERKMNMINKLYDKKKKLENKQIQYIAYKAA
jgi:hypothetical protein